MDGVGVSTDLVLQSAPGAEAGAASAVTDNPPAHYFRMMKELALLGYFTSEIGMTQAQRYAETPGRYDPCLPYTAGEKSWAPHAEKGLSASRFAGLSQRKLTSRQADDQ